MTLRPEMTQVASVEPVQLYDFTQKVLFSPAQRGEGFIKLSVTTGKKGAKSTAHSHPRDEVTLTHDFLSTMLGVRRAGVTVSLHILEGQGLVRATRGLIRILDREGLEEMVGGCYGVPEAEYARLLTG